MKVTTEKLKMRVGGLVVSALQEGLPGKLGAEPHFLPFLTEGEPDLELVFRRGRIMEERALPVFDSGGVWRLFRHPDGKLRYDLSDALFGPEPYAQALVDPGHTEGEVRLRTLGGHERAGILYPFVYPLDELLAISLLSLRGGLHVHAAGIDDGGHGLLFPGISGAGKSTTSRLWREQPGVRVLSDDRTIIRFHEGIPYLYGTPWHGEAELSTPGRARLAGVFFLRKAVENRLTQLGPAEAAAELVARSFPAYWDREGVASALDAATRVTAAVPSFCLHFLPGVDAVDTVREAFS